MDLNLMSMVEEIFEKGDFPDVSVQKHQLSQSIPFEEIGNGKYRFSIESQQNIMNDLQSYFGQSVAFLRINYTFVVDTQKKQIDTENTEFLGSEINYEQLAALEIERTLDMYTDKITNIHSKKEIVKFAKDESEGLDWEAVFKDEIDSFRIEFPEFDFDSDRYLSTVKKYFISMLVSKWERWRSKPFKEVRSTKYSKADLVWEATRRNMNYIEEFKKASLMFAPIVDSAKKNIIPNIEASKDPFELHMLNLSMKRIPDESVDCIKWKIFMPFKNSLTGLSEIHRWLDPAISIDDLLKDDHEFFKNISENISLLCMAHPYFSLFESDATDENNFYYSDLHDTIYKTIDRFDETKSDNDTLPLFFNYKINDDTYFCVHKNLIKKNILFWFNPTDKDAKIIHAFQNIKSKVLTEMKMGRDNYKEAGGRSYYPRDIDKYIGWLKKYDEARELYKKKTNKTKLIIVNGAEILPSNFVNVILDKDSTPRQKKAYNDAHDGAVELIQTTPNIIFSPSRTRS